MDAPLELVVSLWIHGDVAAFEELERRCVVIMARHGGRIERAVRVQSPSSGAPFEVHVVHFPGQRAWDAYRSDPETLALSGQRARVIERTEILRGVSVNY